MKKDFEHYVKRNGWYWNVHMELEFDGEGCATFRA